MPLQIVLCCNIYYLDFCPCTFSRFIYQNKFRHQKAGAEVTRDCVRSQPHASSDSCILNQSMKNSSFYGNLYANVCRGRYRVSRSKNENEKDKCLDDAKDKKEFLQQIFHIPIQAYHTGGCIIPPVV